MNSRYILLLVTVSLLLGYTSIGFAQNSTITGTVSDAQAGETLPGVNIMVKGTTTGTSTDSEGNFELTVESLQDTLVVSFIGYQTQNVPIEGRTEITIEMQSQAITGEEMVVVGYGEQEERNITGSIDQVSSEALENRPAGNVGDLLRGTSPNLNFSVGTQGGEPGSAPSWNIRGMGSINGGSPLILVDGVEMNPAKVNPNDIESVSVLKDASAAAVYGSRGAFGVVLITTKRGSASGDPSIQYSNNLSLDSPLGLPHYENSLVYTTAYNQAAANAGKAAIYPEEQIERVRRYMNGDFQYEYGPDNPTTGLWSGRRIGNANYDWPDELTKDYSFNQTHNLSVSGGSENLQYYLSAGYLKNNGIYSYGNDSFDRYNLSANFTSDVTDWYTVELTTKFIQRNTDRPIGITTSTRNWFWRNLADFGPLAPKYNINGTINFPHIRNMQDAGRNRGKLHDYNLTLSNEIEPIEGWVTDFTYNYSLAKARSSRNPKPVWVEQGNGNLDNVGKPGTSQETSFSDIEYRKMTLRTSYENTFAADHYFKGMIGYEQEVESHSQLYGEGHDLITEEVPSISTSLGEVSVDDVLSDWATRAVFGRLNYNYKEKYLLEINGRYNGSSRFAPSDRWGLFPSGSLGYRISEEDFWEPIKGYVNSLKLRGSYGALGNQDVARYLYLSTVPVSSQLGWWIDGERPNYAGDPNLISNNITWETIKTLNIGFDARFLDNRLEVNFDWFRRETSDMVGPSPRVPGVLGTSVPQQNNATLETKGYEVEVSWNDNISADFAYNISASLGDNKTTILEYHNENGLIDSYYEGKQVDEIWGYKSAGLIQSEGEEMPDQSEIYSSWGPGDMEYQDLDGDGVISEGSRTLDDHGDLTVIGNETPRYNIGVNAGFNWKWFDFSMLWQGVGKRDYSPASNSFIFWGLNTGLGGSGVYKDSKNLDYWRPADETNMFGSNTDAYFAKPYFSNETFKNRQTQSRYVLNAAYLRLKNIRIGYSLPQSLLNNSQVQDVRVYFSGSNLLTITPLPKNMDPETAIASEASEGGFDRSGVIYPISRTVSIGVNLEF